MELILPLLITLIIEVPIYFLFFKKSLSYLLVIYAMNIVLNVSMNLLLRYVFFRDYYLVLIIMEVIVVIIEAFIIFWYQEIRYKGLYIALAANLASLGIGLALNMIPAFRNADLLVIILLATLFTIEFTVIIVYALKITKKNEKSNNVN